MNRNTKSEDPVSRQKVGILGLGLMGTAFATNLLNKGYSVHVYDRKEVKARPLVHSGAVFHRTPRELGEEVDIAITALTDEVAVRQVVTGKAGLLGGMKKGGLWVEMSTIDPDESTRLSQEAKLSGIERLDAPVVGIASQAREGKVILLAGGDKGLFRKHKHFLSDLGSQVIYLGKDANGHKMKLVINMYMSVVGLAYAEALVLARKLGFPPGVFADTLNRTPHRNVYTEGRGPRVEFDNYSPMFTLKNLAKDVRLAGKQARKSGAFIPVSSLAAQIYAAALEEGLGEEDFSVVTSVVKKLSGMPSKSVR
ncbi:MAG TPA: NAD(P)-dependent oxidoreductase [Nitrososphaerales archaeon]|nr:NAD(P)-dependent oxidoreductase [Nitrososphaerales archaeon]